ncbi:TonB-linked outer membrane protein, SusC/RagA family [Chryseolinea serpens]|uniref:TonB-linked outer membrane protein, SusC/RagA family n=1 Tax=Chryseolinea serpens TaxID=947013 RepID=A0A1M5XTB6_9BACT|nr:TonB-dependent receptor [Chryseolinea serpens]SHI03047.1 TonB-linked outer membrane protein, SusC/RagA family [Chryseolinea serpens]
MKRILLFFGLLASSLYGYAQNPAVVRGRITSSEDGTALPGVNVLVKGTSTGTSTDADGNYSIAVPAKATLLFSFIGYLTQEVALSNDQTVANIALEADAKELQEIVIVGYGEQSRKTLTGSQTSVSFDELKSTPAPSPDQLIQGKAAGVQVTANSGVPGGGIFIRVRGTNSINASNDPLYIVDGVFINNNNLVRTGLGNQVASNPLADINPSDIESLEILKDANATAIYGSRGANGVVLIRTKRGKANSRSRINFNTYQGWSWAPKKFKVVTGPELATLQNERFLNDGGSPELVPFRSKASGGSGLPEEQPTYDRISDVFRTARTRSYELSASGGNDKTQYYIGGGYFNQESIVKPSEFDRYSLRINLDQHLNEQVKIGTSTALTRTHRNVSSNDNNPVGVINSALFPKSNLPVFNENGTYAKYGSFDNHLALIDNLNNNATGTRVISNVFGEYAITENLTFRTSWSIDFNDMYENNYNNTLILAGQPKGTATSALSRDVTLLNEQTLTYLKTWDKLSLQVIAGNTIQKNTYQVTSLSGQQFPTNSLETIASAATQTGTSTKAESALLSYFGKASATWNQRYTLDASFRADASSRFGVSNRWGYFPAVGAAWRLGEERFIKDLGIFDELKLRASVGKTGNQAGISEYASIGLWQGGNNYTDSPGTAPLQLANPNLSWEETRQWNVGLDLGFFRDRLTFDINYYDKYTSGLLLNVPVPLKSGYSSLLQNYGAVSNKGFELTVTGDIIRSADFQWTSSFNISTNKNKIEKLAAPFTAGSRDIFRLQEGIPLYSFWIYKQLYVDPQTGDAVYDDKGNDGITVADRQIVGNAWPDFYGGFTNTLRYKAFDLNAFFYFEKGAQIMNMNRFFLVHGGTQSNIGYIPEQLERWQKPGDITDIPRMTTVASSNNYGGTVQNLSSRYLEDGSFIRLRTVSLGYNVPKALLSKYRVASLRLYVQGTNLWTGTGYSGLDPEVNSQSGVGNTKNFDWATVPQPRTVQVGLNIGL